MQISGSFKKGLFYVLFASEPISTIEENLSHYFTNCLGPLLLVQLWSLLPTTLYREVKWFMLKHVLITIPIQAFVQEVPLYLRGLPMLRMWKHFWSLAYIILAVTVFKDLFIQKLETEIHTGRIFYLPCHFPDGYNSQGWTRLKPGTRCFL